MERLGLIEGEVNAEDQLRRRRFRLTKKGKTALRRWVESELEYPPERDAERIQLMFLDESPVEAIRDHLRRHYTHYQARLIVWRDMKAAVLTGKHRQHESRPLAHSE